MVQSELSHLKEESIQASLSYEAYLELMEALVAEGKTSGPNQSEEFAQYTKMNLKRMQRLNKTIVLSDALASQCEKVDQEITFLALTEYWCGDAAQNLPLFNKLVEQNPKLSFKLLFRDENLDLMDAFLTNGGRSIPKVIALDTHSLKVLGSWGPRPTPAQEMVLAFKKSGQDDYQEFLKEIQLWYAKDKTLSQQAELILALSDWLSKHNK